MGIKSLHGFLRSKNLIENGKLSDFAGKIIGIDIMIYLYRYSAWDITELMIMFIDIFLKKNIIPFFIFDARIEKNRNSVEVKLYNMDEDNSLMNDKESTLSKRRSAKKKNYQEREFLYLYENWLNSMDFSVMNNIDFINNLKMEAINNFLEKINSEIDDELYMLTYTDEEKLDLITWDMEKISNKIKQLRRLTTSIKTQEILKCYQILVSYGIPYIVSQYESEPLLAKLCLENKIAGVLSADTDLLAYKCPVLIDLDNIHSNNVEIFRYENILRGLELNDNEFLDMCILFGNDYCDRLRCLKSPENIYNTIKESKCIERVIEDLITNREGFKRIRLKREDREKFFYTREIYQREIPEKYIKIADRYLRRYVNSTICDISITLCAQNMYNNYVQIQNILN